MIDLEEIEKCLQATMPAWNHNESGIYTEDDPYVMLLLFGSIANNANYFNDAVFAVRAHNEFVPKLVIEVKRLTEVLHALTVILKDAHSHDLTADEMRDVITKAESIARHGYESE